MAAGIYKITNVINGKFYIGSTINFNKRKSEHFNNAKHKEPRYHSILYKAMRKYGCDNFKFDILEEVPIEDLSLKDRASTLENKEQDYVNLTNPYYNMRKLDITRNVGVAYGGNHPKTKYVCVFDLNGVFIEKVKGARNTAKKYDVAMKTLKKHCNTLSFNQLSRFIFKYEEDFDKSARLIKWKKLKKYTYSNTIPIEQYDLEGNFIRDWRCANEARKELSLNKGAVNRVLSGEYKHTKGHMFKFKDNG